MREVRIGPYTFEFLPDGDDPGVGAVRVTSRSGFTWTSAFDWPRSEWDEFAEAAP